VLVCPTRLLIVRRGYEIMAQIGSRSPGAEQALWRYWHFLVALLAV
jgi:hypothetical protein